MAIPPDEILAYAATATGEDIPRTYAEAMSDTNAPLWRPPIAHEIRAHETNGTYDIINIEDLPLSIRLVGTRWVFDAKKNEQGNIIKRKARLVAQGFSQRPGVDYDDTYSPVMRYDSLRLIIWLSLYMNWILRQMDFDAAYLNSMLKHIIYARCPPGVGNPSVQALRLRKALYGLKQSGREWYDVLREWLRQLGFIAASFDPCVFINKDLVIGIYVDDVLMAGEPEAVTAFMTAAGQRFRMKDLGRPKLLLGLEFDYDDDVDGNRRRRIYLHQRTYINAVLRRYDMDKCNARKTPLDPNHFPPRSDEPVDEERQRRHQSIVGSINFLAIVSRPDLSYTVSMLGSYNANPSDQHVTLAAQVLRYLRGSVDFRIVINQDARSEVAMYTDASFGSDPDNAKSFSGYLMKLNGSTVAWSSKRQSCVAKSTMEAEYMAASYAAAHLAWARQALIELLDNVDHWQFKLLVDNQAAMSLIQDSKISARSKHIAVHYHFVRERYHNNEFVIEHVASKDNLADLCTKALPLPLLTDLKSRIANGD